MSNPDIVALRAFLASGAATNVTASPLLAALGARFESYDAASATLTMSFRPSDLFRQGAGLIQGGAIAAMLDFGMAFAAFAGMKEGSGAVTTTLTSNLLGAAKSDRVEVIGRVRRAGRRVIFAEAEMQSEGKLVATASSSLLPLAG